MLARRIRQTLESLALLTLTIYIYVYIYINFLQGEGGIVLITSTNPVGNRKGVVSFFRCT